MLDFASKRYFLLCEGKWLKGYGASLGGKEVESASVCGKKTRSGLAIMSLRPAGRSLHGHLTAFADRAPSESPTTFLLDRHRLRVHTVRDCVTVASQLHVEAIFVYGEPIALLLRDPRGQTMRNDA